MTASPSVSVAVKGLTLLEKAKKLIDKLKGGDDVNGTVHVNGTAHAKGTVWAGGMAHKGGSWGAKKTETALVGELGPEIVVRGDRWFTVGDQGAEFTGIQKGDITYGNIIDVYPFSNDMCVIEATGQQILDALEWGARAVPDETGAFLQVSGLSYELDPNIPSTCTSDEEGMFTGITGERRVSNVLVGGKPIDPDARYTVAGSLYLLQQHGDGFTMFDNATIVNISGGLDSEVIINYIKETLGGEIGEQYADPYGDGRITIK
jgi:hypothetical protein